MAEPPQRVRTSVEPRSVGILNWIVAAFLGIYIEVLANVLRQFGADVRGPMTHLDVRPPSYLLLYCIVVLPKFGTSKAAENLIDRRSERLSSLSRCWSPRFSCRHSPGSQSWHRDTETAGSK